MNIVTLEPRRVAASVQTRCCGIEPLLSKFLGSVLNNLSRIHGKKLCLKKKIERVNHF